MKTVKGGSNNQNNKINNNPVQLLKNSLWVTDICRLKIEQEFLLILMK